MNGGTRKEIHALSTTVFWKISLYKNDTLFKSVEAMVHACKLMSIFRRKVSVHVVFSGIWWWDLKRYSIPPKAVSKYFMPTQISSPTETIRFLDNLYVKTVRRFSCGSWTPVYIKSHFFYQYKISVVITRANLRKPGVLCFCVVFLLVTMIVVANLLGEGIGDQIMLLQFCVQRLRMMI